MEFLKEVVTVKVDYKCDYCNQGVLRHSGGALMSNPPKYPHRCTNCDKHQNCSKIYPCIEYRDKE